MPCLNVSTSSAACMKSQKPNVNTEQTYGLDDIPCGGHCPCDSITVGRNAKSAQESTCDIWLCEVSKHERLCSQPSQACAKRNSAGLWPWNTYKASYYMSQWHSPSSSPLSSPAAGSICQSSCRPMMFVSTSYWDRLQWLVHLKSLNISHGVTLAVGGVRKHLILNEGVIVLTYVYSCPYCLYWYCSHRLCKSSVNDNESFLGVTPSFPTVAF